MFFPFLFSVVASDDGISQYASLLNSIFHTTRQEISNGRSTASAFRYLKKTSKKKKGFFQSDAANAEHKQKAELIIRTDKQWTEQIATRVPITQFFNTTVANV